MSSQEVDDIGRTKRVLTVVFIGLEIVFGYTTRCASGDYLDEILHGFGTDPEILYRVTGSDRFLTVIYELGIMCHSHEVSEATDI
jgi:hypothetical protein